MTGIAWEAGFCFRARRTSGRSGATCPKGSFTQHAKKKSGHNSPPVSLRQNTSGITSDLTTVLSRPLKLLSTTGAEYHNSTMQSDFDLAFELAPAKAGEKAREIVWFWFVPAPDEALSDILLEGPFPQSVYTILDRYRDELNTSFDVEPWPALIEREERRRKRKGHYFLAAELPAVVHDIIVAIASSGVTATVLALLKAWVDARNGRQVRIKVGDIEVEATQMPEKDVLRLFDLIEQKADRQKIRALLLNSRHPPEHTNTP